MKNETRSPHTRKEHAPARAGQCIALIDSNYMAWLVRQSPEANAEPENYNRITLLPTLAHALKQAGLNVELQRVYWYTDTPDNQFPQDQIVRHLDSAAGEPSDVVLQAMSLDISRLAERHACDHLLIASDDDRLTHVIDEAQLHGLQVAGRLQAGCWAHVVSAVMSGALFRRGMEVASSPACIGTIGVGCDSRSEQRRIAPGRLLGPIGKFRMSDGRPVSRRPAAPSSR